MLNEKTARRAIELATPTIEAMLGGEEIGKSDLHVTVATRADGWCRELAYQSFGDTANWAYPYDQIAGGKAELSGRTGLPSREVVLVRTDLLREGDSKYWGSVVLGDIIVACSGVQSYFDEAIAGVIAHILRGLIDHEVDGQREDESSYFFRS